MTSRPAMPTLEGSRVLTLESRRSPELALLVMNYGGKPIVAPSVREVPLASNRQAIAFATDVIRGRFGMVILMTGVGVRLLMKVIEPLLGREPFIGSLARTLTVARGPKTVSALRELGITPWVTVPSPNTWRELLATLDSRADEAHIADRHVAIQEYGLPNAELLKALTARGAHVTSVPVYRWAMPDDVEPLREAVRTIVRNEVDIVILTASIQLVHLLSVARDLGLEAAVRHALDRVVVASIGPMTSEELRHHGLPIDYEPTQPKMGFLVKEIAERWRALLEVKRRQDPIASTEVGRCRETTT
jgi:uroporphyrinogen-III synthase